MGIPHCKGHLAECWYHTSTRAVLNASVFLTHPADCIPLTHADGAAGNSAVCVRTKTPQLGRAKWRAVLVRFLIAVLGSRQRQAAALPRQEHRLSHTISAWLRADKTHLRLS